MAYINLLDNVGCITNKEEILKGLSSITTIPVDKLNLSQINANAENESKVRYFKNYMEDELENDELKRAVYMLIDTGYKYYGEGGYPIYISMTRGKFEWVGGVVGTEKYLKSKAQYKKEANSITLLTDKVHTPYRDEKVKKVMDDSIRDTCSKLESLLPESFKVGKNMNSFIPKYLNMLSIRLKVMMDREKSEYYITYNKDNMAVINSGLLNARGNNIYLKMIISDEIISPIGVFKSESDLRLELADNLVSMSELRPMCAFDSMEESHMRLRESECDFEFETGLRHILDDRRDRLPESLINLPENLIHYYIEQSFRMALALQDVDVRYSTAIYSVRKNGIAYCFPLVTDFEDTNTAFIVVCKCNGMWKPVTILTEELFLSAKAVLYPYSK